MMMMSCNYTIKQKRNKKLKGEMARKEGWKKEK
jgi:hypothetical protein